MAIKLCLLRELVSSCIECIPTMAFFISRYILLFDQQSPMEFLDRVMAPTIFMKVDTFIENDNIGTSRGVATKS